MKTELSKREAEFADAVASGLSNIQVARRFFVTEKTVKFHLTKIFKKLGIKSRKELSQNCKITP